MSTDGCSFIEVLVNKRLNRDSGKLLTVDAGITRNVQKKITDMKLCVIYSITFCFAKPTLFTAYNVN